MEIEFKPVLEKIIILKFSTVNRVWRFNDYLSAKKEEWTKMLQYTVMTQKEPSVIDHITVVLILSSL